MLVLYSNQRTLPANQQIQEGLWTSLEGAISARRIELFEEYLEAHRLPAGTGDEEPPMASYLEKRYREMRPDVVVAVGPQSVEFSTEWLADIFPAALPIFAALRRDQLEEIPEPRPKSGVLYTTTTRPILEAAASLLPNTREVVLVGGDAPFDRRLLSVIRGQIQKDSPWAITEIAGEPPEVIAEKLSQAAPGTIVLFTSFFKDNAGVTYIPREVLEQISAGSSVPIFVFYETMLGFGATGIAAAQFNEQGRDLGNILERLASGESPSEIGIAVVTSHRLLFDDREMRRYGLNPRLLPPGAELFFEKRSIIETHPVAFSVGLITILVQSLLIGALLLTRYRKKKAEQRAHEMEHYFSTVFERSPNPMAVIRVRDEIFQDINPAWELLYGVSRATCIGHTPIEAGILFGDADDELYQDFLAGHRSLAGYERRIRTGSGEIRNVAFYSNPIEIDGECLQIMTTVDAQDRVEAEKLRRNLARDNRIAQLGQISAWIAHEINQPLGSILNNAETGLLVLDSGSEFRGELREVLSDIKSENRRASGIVERIRSMLGSHKAMGERIAVPMILDEVMRTATPEATRRSVSLRSASDELPEVYVFGDPVLLVQVFLNLVFNAMDAVAEVPMSARIVTLGCELLPGDQMVDFTVCDRGPGIDPAQLESIFEFFHTTKEDGLGLGLAISRAILKDHAGNLCVENLGAGGACFHVRLPVHKETK